MAALPFGKSREVGRGLGREWFQAPSFKLEGNICFRSARSFGLSQRVAGDWGEERSPLIPIAKWGENRAIKMAGFEILRKTAMGMIGAQAQ
jgi:hypothetical protein